MYLKFIFFFIPSLILAGNIENQFITLVNMFRTDPIGYKTKFNVIVDCQNSLYVSYKILMESEELNNASYFQANTLSYNNCTIISHNTCSLYCNQFQNSCDYYSRIQSFCPSYATEFAEILTKGPKNIQKIFNLFLDSQGHCDHILLPNIDSIGCSFQRNDKNIFVSEFANLQRTYNENSFISGYHIFIDGLFKFYVHVLEDKDIFININNKDIYKMNKYFNNYFYEIILENLNEPIISYYFTDLNNNSITYYT